MVDAFEGIKLDLPKNAYPGSNDVTSEFVLRI